ncbi:MAG: DinB family protein, partial [Bacteroidetes bacterium]|nr:DinB family protein [Bacteroidota bacterium]
MKEYRDNSAIGALLDEYERAILELIKVISDISNDELTSIVDKETKDLDYVSIQTILTHVVSSGYGYAVVIRKYLGETIDYVEREKLDTVQAYTQALKKMFAFNEQLFQDYPNLKLEEMESG